MDIIALTIACAALASQIWVHRNSRRRMKQFRLEIDELHAEYAASIAELRVEYEDSRADLDARMAELEALVDSLPALRRWRGRPVVRRPCGPPECPESTGLTEVAHAARHRCRKNR